jgi:hypothetical protein
MRSVMRKLALLLFALSFSSISYAANAHQATVTWTASPDSTVDDPGTVSVWRFDGRCSAVTGITRIASGLAAGGSYVDYSVQAKHYYCYVVTAVIDGFESEPSNSWEALIPVGPPTVKGATVK